MGHWYLNLKTKTVVFNPLKVQAMGYSMEELPDRITYDFFTDRLHPEDYEGTMAAMRNHIEGKASVYECEYRIQTKDGRYKWFYDRGKITQRNTNGKPEFAAGIVFDISEKKENEQKLINKNKLLEIQSSTDALTGVLNRRAIIEKLDKCANQALVNHSPFSIILLDIDHFKKINDENGHLYGDKVLGMVATTISKLIRDIDSVGRYGGEEFLIILPNTDKSEAIIIAKRIREAVKIIDLPQNNFVTISGGVAVLDGDSITELINKADMKLYEAKNDGRNRIKS